MNEFRSLLKQYRERVRVSQTRLAEYAGFDHSYVSRLESGGREPIREAVQRLADALELGIHDSDRLFASAGFMPDDSTSSGPLMDVMAERSRQSLRWGVQSLSWPEWILVLTEEVGEAAQAANASHWHDGSLAHLRDELVQVSAVAIQIIEAIDSIETGGSAESEAAA